MVEDNEHNKCYVKTSDGKKIWFYKRKDALLVKDLAQKLTSN